jgi:hypothetical protein
MLVEPAVWLRSWDVESEGNICAYCGDDGSWELDAMIPGGGRTLPEAIVDGEVSARFVIWDIGCLRGDLGGDWVNDSGESMVSSLNTLASVS